MFRYRRKYLIGLDVFNPYLFNVSVIFQSELMILMLPNWATLRGKAELTNCHDVKKLLEVSAINFKYNRFFDFINKQDNLLNKTQNREPQIRSLSCDRRSFSGLEVDVAPRQHLMIERHLLISRDGSTP